MFDEKLQQINKALIELQEKKTFISAQTTINTIISLLDIEANNKNWGLFVDKNNKIVSNSSWFEMAEGYSDRRATYKINIDQKYNVDLKTYWLNKKSKARLSWCVMLTPNFEDWDGARGNRYNVGIDFFIPKDCSKIIIILSKNHVLRTLELQGELTNTQKKIFENWNQQIDFTNKAQFHKILWDSFDFEGVNKEFFKRISGFFTEEIEYLSEEKEIFDKKEAAFFTNKLIGRLIFLWFLDKKGIVDKAQRYFELNGVGSTEYYQKKLSILFFEVLNTDIKNRGEDIDKETPYLNGGLFEQNGDDRRVLSENDIFPADYFNRFFDFLNHYNFTTDESSSDYQQTAIDPEMLGRIFENLLAEQSEETGKSARKAKGAFYTPREIVDYMTKQTLLEYLKTSVKVRKDHREYLERIITAKTHKWSDQQRNYRRDIKPYKDEIIKALDNFTVLDPACGSGAFPMGMLQLLVETYERIERRFDAKKVKKQVIKNNLYGVDIEPMAVEISRLRAWLAIVVDEDDDNKNIKPLPNLDFKFITANSLLPLDSDEGQQNMFDNSELAEKMQKIREKYFDTGNKRKKEKLRKDFAECTKKGQLKLDASNREKQLLSYDPFELNKIAEFFDPEFMFSVDSFDCVIGNPPYVSTKGQNNAEKETLKEAYGFVDDLYSHFYFKGLDLVEEESGILTYITSKTFWTIQTKKNLRKMLQKNEIIEIFDTANPFEAAMVDTCIVILRKKESKNYEFTFSDGTKDLLCPIIYKVDNDLYKNAVNQVFFIPTKLNLQIYEKYNQKVSNLMKDWWSKIDTSRKITRNKEELKGYRHSLKAGNVTLLGLLTEGGQGLATANNGRFVGVRENTKQAEAIKISRIIKLQKANEKIKNIEFDNPQVLSNKSEEEIWKLFDELKEKYGRDIFGQGYLFRIVSGAEIADVNEMSEEEKKLGIEKAKSHFVPYDKGDKDGNRWWLETPFVINWSEEIVQFFKKNSGKKGGGMPVLRNPQFYFRRGFCWTDVNSTYLKSRVKAVGVYDVLSMSLFTQMKKLPDFYFVCLINSEFISKYVKDFVNTTSHFQINDARQIPIIIPTESQLQRFRKVFDEAFEIKKKQFSGKMDEIIAAKQLNDIQIKLDKMVYELYELTEEEIEIVEKG